MRLGSLKSKSLSMQLKTWQGKQPVQHGLIMAMLLPNLGRPWDPQSENWTGLTLELQTSSTTL